VHAFDVLGDPVRRRILELLADGEHAAGAVTDDVRARFGISQPAVSQHLRVLREAGLVTVRVDGPRRLYAVRPEPLREVDAWLDRFRPAWTPPRDAPTTAPRDVADAAGTALPGPAGRLDALDTEMRRGRRRTTPIGEADDDRSAG
jgi:DNA-binding transcriptional ArsR family regulator